MTCFFLHAMVVCDNWLAVAYVRDGEDMLCWYDWLSVVKCVMTSFL